MPSGQDRIVPIFLATLAVQQKSQVIRFQSASEMLETFGTRAAGNTAGSSRPSSGSSERRCSSERTP